MKKVYLIYAKIPSVLFDAKLHEFVSDESKYKFSNKYYIGLYAWTSNKILLDAFLKFRKGAKGIYRIIKREFTKDEYRMFRKENFHEELLYYRIPNKGDSFSDNFSIGYEPSKKDSKKEKESFFSKDEWTTQIVCTRYECESLFVSAHQLLYEYMGQCIQADYIAFKDKYQHALDYIGYCDTFNDIHDGYDYDDNEDTFYSDRHESSQFNKSYNISFYGNPAIDIYENKVALFVNVFYEMIVGYDPNREIKLLIYR